MVRVLDKYTRRILFYPDRVTKLYYVKFTPKDHPPVWKIGITTQTIKKRFAGEKVPYEIIFIVETDGRTAYLEEQRVLLEYDAYRLPYTPILKSGNSELFSVDIREFSHKGIL